MKTQTLQTLLPALLLGGLLFTPGCGTPTVIFGEPTWSDRAVLHVRSATPSKVQCVWLQDGASIQHNGMTPFRLILPASAVRKVTLLKEASATDVSVEVRSPGTEPARFVMTRGAASVELVRDSRRWESRVY